MTQLSYNDPIQVQYGGQTVTVYFRSQTEVAIFAETNPTVMGNKYWRLSHDLEVLGAE